MSDSNLVRKGPCPDCGSSDACAVYDDGHTHCFSCETTTSAKSAPPLNPTAVTFGTNPELQRLITLWSTSQGAAIPERSLMTGTTKK